MRLQSADTVALDIDGDLRAFDCSQFGLDHFQTANEETLYGQYLTTARRLQIARDTATRSQFARDEIAEKMLDAKTDAEWRRLKWERENELTRRDIARKQAAHLEETARTLREQLPDLQDDAVLYRLHAELYFSRLQRDLFECVLNGKSPAGFFRASKKLPQDMKRRFVSLISRQKLPDGSEETPEQAAARISRVAQDWYMRDRTERFMPAGRAALLGENRVAAIDAPEPREWR